MTFPDTSGELFSGYRRKIASWAQAERIRHAEAGSVRLSQMRTNFPVAILCSAALRRHEVRVHPVLHRSRPDVERHVSVRIEREIEIGRGEVGGLAGEERADQGIR